MAIISMTPEQIEVLRRSIAKEKASKNLEKKNLDPVSEAALEKVSEQDMVAPVSVNQEEAPPEIESSESTSFKSYKKRK